jgi:hypothetical protein
MQNSNRAKFVTEVLHSNPSIKNDNGSNVDYDILHQDIKRFILVQGDEFFETNSLEQIMEGWNYFQNN